MRLRTKVLLLLRRLGVLPGVFLSGAALATAAATGALNVTGAGSGADGGDYVLDGYVLSDYVSGTGYVATGYVDAGYVI